MAAAGMVGHIASTARRALTAAAGTGNC